jgi:hypothetical protein
MTIERKPWGEFFRAANATKRALAEKSPVPVPSCRKCGCPVTWCRGKCTKKGK